MKLKELKRDNTLAVVLVIMLVVLLLAGVIFSVQLYRREKKIEKVKLENERLQGIIEAEEKANHTLSKQLADVTLKRENNKIFEDLISLYLGKNGTMRLIRDEIFAYNNYEDYHTANYQAFIIYFTAIENNIDPLLMLSVAKKENRIRHVVNDKVTVNGKNAKGMFQITPIVESIYNLDALVFEENVYIAVKFLRSLLNRYKDLELALSHYNAGSKARHALAYYPETIDYVDSIMKYYEDYQERIEEDEYGE